MSASAIHKALPPVDATTMTIDLRNFTPNQNAASSRGKREPCPYWQCPLLHCGTW